jgi:cytochrome d ubiquinol oxidase subunit I
VVSAVLNGALPVAAAGLPAVDQQYLLEARQMQALSLAVHIPLVCFGIAFPAMVLFCEWRYLRTGDLVYRTVARRWSRIMLALFAVGVVTGTILSFELGLLWPEFMASFANVFGLGFTLEGFSFFVEAIFIAIYVYGWDRLRPGLHFLSGIPVAIAGVTGSLFVISVNGWMNHPSGFQLEDGRAVDADPWSALFGNSYFWHEFVHMYFAAYIVAGFLVAAAYAWGFLRGRWGRYQRTALTVALSAAAIAAPLQVVIGDWAAREVAAKQPVKLAALEGLGPTTEGAPEHLLGWYNGEEVVYGIEIPRLLSLLAYHDPDATVTGLDSVPADERPPVNVVRFAFQTMVGIGTLLALIGLVYFLCPLPAQAAAEISLVLSGGRPRGPTLRRGADFGLDHDRGRPPALDRLSRHAHLGGGDGRRRHPRGLRHARRRLPWPRRHHRLAAPPLQPRPARDQRCWLTSRSS